MAGVSWIRSDPMSAIAELPDCPTRRPLFSRWRVPADAAADAALEQQVALPPISERCAELLTILNELFDGADPACESRSE